MTDHLTLVVAGIALFGYVRMDQPNEGTLPTVVDALLAIAAVLLFVDGTIRALWS